MLKALCHVFSCCTQTQRNLGKAEVSPARCHDGASARNATETKNLLWYSHELHEPHRHRHLGLTRLDHGKRFDAHSPILGVVCKCHMRLSTPVSLQQLSIESAV